MRNLGLISRQMQMEISERVSSIKQALAANSDEKAKGAVKKFIPSNAVNDLGPRCVITSVVRDLHNTLSSQRPKAKM